MKNLKSFKVFEKYRGKDWLNNLSMDIVKLKKNPEYTVKLEHEKVVIPFTDIERVKLKIREIFEDLIIKIYKDGSDLQILLKLKHTNGCSINLLIKELDDEYFYIGFSIFLGHLYTNSVTFICDQEEGLLYLMKKIKKLIE
jgi:hypothetical protein